MNRSVLREIRKQKGRPCPRVELEPGNRPIVAVLPYVIQEDLRPLLPQAVASTALGDSDLEADLLERLPRVLSHEGVREVLYQVPPPPPRSKRKR